MEEHTRSTQNIYTNDSTETKSSTTSNNLQLFSASRPKKRWSIANIPVPELHECKKIDLEAEKTEMTHIKYGCKTTNVLRNAVFCLWSESKRAKKHWIQNTLKQNSCLNKVIIVCTRFIRVSLAANVQWVSTKSLIRQSVAVLLLSN